ncbi:MAG: GNAT family N-acetyltransferase, partial [Pseudomonadota bacterium]
SRSSVAAITTKNNCPTFSMSGEQIQQLEMEIGSNDKLVLKTFADEHIGNFVDAVLESEKTVGAWMPWWKKSYSARDAKEWFDACAENIENNTAYDIGIFLKDSDYLAGGISVNNIDWENRIGNIGYWVRESLQHQGVGTGAIKLIEAFGFNALGLVRLEIVAIESNLISRKAAERSGFEFECVAKNRLFHNNRPVTAAIYSSVVS